MVNRVVIVGRLTRAPELKTTTTGKHVAHFSIAVDDRFNKDNTNFFNVSCWDKTAEFVSKYLDKGRLVAVDGRLQQRKWTTSEGQTRDTVEIVADSVQGLDKPRDGASPNAVSDERDPFEDE